MNYNSFLAKIYRFLYDVEKMPENLFSYVFKSIIALILIIPSLLFSLLPFYIPCFILYRTINLKYKRIPEAIKFSYIVYLILLILKSVTCSVINIFHHLPEKYNIFILVGNFIIWSILVISFIIFIVNIEDVYNWIKNKYNKFSPKIKWNDNSSKK